MMSFSLKFLAKARRILGRINPGTTDISHSPNIGELPDIPPISRLTDRPVISEIPSISGNEIARNSSSLDTSLDLLSSSSTSLFTTGNSFMINAQKLNSIVQNFVSSVSDIQGAAIVTTDGLELASVLSAGMDPERVAAMSAAMLSLGERISSELARGIVDRIMIEGDLGYGVLTNCGSEAVLLVLASKVAKQGILQLEIKRLASEVKLALS
jgi:uncharacterized protein